MLNGPVSGAHGGTDLILLTFAQVTALDANRLYPIGFSKKRPQQDSNLCTRLRRPCACRALTGENRQVDWVLGANWGGRFSVAQIAAADQVICLQDERPGQR